MRIRQLRHGDAEKAAELFRDTVARINRRDYSSDQIRAWAPGDMDVEMWRSRLQKGRAYVAESGEGKLLGFISIDRNGHIDLLYCHADHQGQGVGSRLLSHAERQIKASGVTHVSTEASITARPFFEKRGFEVVKEQKVRRNGSNFINYVMVKHY
ncbi:MAG TPA: GNAT family N-acetyltransferase [Deltaproteobacteria bacterium]|jgi:ribosomal protein S18 acetylase RimI-like enzyme|nr:GNAT family N-acetyltransferase [Deltaproteobacteria bacterium]